MTLGAVWLASLLGSLHCVGMCGGFSGLVGASGGHRGRRRTWLRLGAYHGTRVAAYTSLGALAGALGSGLELFGRAAGLSRFAGPAMGVLLVALALRGLLRGTVGPADPTLVRLHTPARGLRAQLDRLQGGLTRALTRPGLTGAAAAGLLAAFLPCLWLWSYVVLAASTGSALGGAGVMLAFGAGTLPALALVGGLAGSLRSRWGAHAPRLAAGLLLLLGLASIAGWTGGPVTPPLAASPGEIPTDAPCHATVPAGPPTSEDRG